MAWRVEEKDVFEIIDGNADLSMGPFIEMATALTDYVSSQDSRSVLTAALLVQIEKNLAAHYYSMRDPQYDAKKTDDVSAKFQGEFGMHLDATRWGQAAMIFDVSGTLRKLSKGVSLGTVTWLGKPPSTQIDYVDRD
jgi:hypothetical protein